MPLYGYNRLLIKQTELAKTIPRNMAWVLLLVKEGKVNVNLDWKSGS